MFRHASIIFGHHPIFPWRGRSGQKIFFEHEIFDGFQYWFDILGNRFGCVVAAPLSCAWHKKSIVVRQCQWKFWKSGDTQMQECFLSLSYLYIWPLIIIGLWLANYDDQREITLRDSLQKLTTLHKARSVYLWGWCRMLVEIELLP